MRVTVSYNRLEVYDIKDKDWQWAMETCHGNKEEAWGLLLRDHPGVTDGAYEPVDEETTNFCLAVEKWCGGQ